MAKKVGIPRGLFYYRYFPLWETFFEEIGAELTVSDRTTKKILDDGVRVCVDEACVPIKLFHGHVMNLKDRVDYLFIPRFTSVSKREYICPKFGGLPDMIRHTIKDLPEIIDVEVNLWKSEKNAFKAAMQVGELFTSNRARIRDAYDKALQKYREFRERVKNGALPSDILDRKVQIRKINPTDSLDVAVIGHAYNLYDSYINMDLINKLRREGVNVITIEMIDGKIINKKSESLPKKMFWNFGKTAVGSIEYILEKGNVDGIIYLMTFGCGVDAFVSDLVERKVRRAGNIPVIILTIDEHSGEAGMNTRIEAFIDMIRWRSRNENNFPAYG